MTEVETKRSQLAEVLDHGPAMLHVDARKAGVVVPASLLTDFHLRLNVSYRFSPQDLSVNDWGVRETLSFGQRPFACAIPWPAIFAISNQQKVWVFPKDIPEELLSEFTKAAEAPAEPGLRLITDAPAGPEAPQPEQTPPTPRLKLRLVKNE